MFLPIINVFRLMASTIPRTTAPAGGFFMAYQSTNGHWRPSELYNISEPTTSELPIFSTKRQSGTSN
jgi:hypothetical protein